MADAVISFLVENVEQLPGYQLMLIEEALIEVKMVLELVEKLNAFVSDPAIQGEERFRVLLMQIREVVYAAEDISDSFIMLELKRNIHNIERRLSLAKQLISYRKTKLTPMLKRVHRIKSLLLLRSYAPKQHDSILLINQVPTISPDNIVGFEDESKTLIENVMEESERLDVISITGMPGIGKTTLAWKIFRDPKIRKEFRTRIWINLAQGLDSNIAVFLHIQKELAKQEQQYGLPDDYDRHRPFKFLRNIKFLLVLDNVLTVKDWNAIKDLMPMGNKSGKVLITSQNESVCMLASREVSHRKPHKVRLLKEKESWELLQLQVFGKLNIICPHWLQDVGRTVAANCNGLPLAIQIIALNLEVTTLTQKARERTVRWWEKVGKNVSMYFTEYYEQQGASNTLELSYNILPQNLKDCFLYLGMFPEDYEIPTSTLKRLWVAEGFIKDTSTQSLEETADDVLQDLLHSNLVMVGKLNSHGKVKTCRVHKVIHGFCKVKALEQNLFQEIKMSEEEDFDPPLSLTPSYRRLCIHSNLLEYLSQKPCGPGVRSFLYYQNESTNKVETKHTSTIHKSFKFLKVFEFGPSIKFVEFPKKLTRLMNLTSISLCCGPLALLPETISHLLNLQTLVVATESEVLEFEGNIWRMIKLRHFITKAAITLPKKGEAGKGGSELQTLTRLSPEYCNEDVFSKTPKLKKLGIRGKLRLNPVHQIQPSCFPSSLTSLAISDTYVQWDQMFVLGEMMNLRVLKFKNNADRGDSWSIIGPQYFPQLEFLFIGGTNLASWEVSPQSFPRLRSLVLHNCGKLYKIPLSLARSLQTLELKNVSESAKESARAIVEKVRMLQLGEPGGESREFKLSIIE